MAKKKGTQKLKSAKKSTRSAKPASPPKKASTRQPKAKPKAKPKAPPASMTFPFICMDCYAEYDLDPTMGMEKIKCANCGHACKLPNQDFFSKFSLYRSQQKKHAFIGVLLGVVMMLAFVGWMYFLMHPGAAMNFSLAETASNLQNVHYAFGGVVGLCAVLLIVEIFQYEKTICHGYF